MPLLFVSLAHGSGVALLIPAGVVILPVLWSYGDTASTDFQQAARSIILRALMPFASQHELDNHLESRVVVNDVVNIGVLTAMILEEVKTAGGVRPERGLLDSGGMNQSGQQVNHEVACDASPIGPISSPAHKTDRVEGDFRGIPEPGIPIQIIRRQARWRHPTLPGAVGSVPAGGDLNRTNVADRPRRNEFPGLDRRPTVGGPAPNFYDAFILFPRGNNCEALGDLVGHWLLRIDVLARIAGVHHDFAVPVVGCRVDDDIDALVVKQFLVMPCALDGLADNLLGERVPAIPQIAGPYTLDARVGNSPAQHAGALLADADHAHPQPVTSCYRGVLSVTGEGIEENGFGGKRGSRRLARSPYKIPTRNTIVDHRLAPPDIHRNFPYLPPAQAASVGSGLAEFNSPGGRQRPDPRPSSITDGVIGKCRDSDMD